VRRCSCGEVRHRQPIKFLGVGEKLDRLEEFRPEAWPSASSAWATSSAWFRGDGKFDAEETAKLQAKMEKGEFTLDDFMSQMGQVKKLGPMGKVMGMIPA
jgi:signal recognition particle subunit SRP54